MVVSDLSKRDELQKILFLSVYSFIVIPQFFYILENETDRSLCIISKKSQENQEIHSTGFWGQRKPQIVSFPYSIVILLKSHSSHIYFITSTKKFTLLLVMNNIGNAFPTKKEESSSRPALLKRKGNRHQSALALR